MREGENILPTKYYPWHIRVLGRKINGVRVHVPYYKILAGFSTCKAAGRPGKQGAGRKAVGGRGEKEVKAEGETGKAVESIKEEIRKLNKNEM